MIATFIALAPRSQASKLRLGMTLGELLVAVAIIAVLLAILIPTLQKSSFSAKRTRDLQHMRQIGIAAGLYEEQNGVFPLRCPTLVDANLLPSTMCGAESDPNPRGGGWLVRRWKVTPGYQLEENPEYPYKESYISVKDHLKSDPRIGWFLADAAKHESDGWLTLYGHSIHFLALGNENGASLQPDYYRLLYSGGIVKRPGGLTPCKDVNLLIPPSYFRDVSDEIMKNACSAPVVSGKYLM